MIDQQPSLTVDDQQAHEEGEKAQWEQKHDAEAEQVEEKELSPEKKLKLERKEAAQKRREREEAEQAEAVREAEETERLAHIQQRKALVARFLEQNGYSGVGIPKRTMLKTKYPIHTAAKNGDQRMIEMLLEENANPMQKDSKGRTAADIAHMKDRKGSYAEVLRVLNAA